MKQWGLLVASALVLGLMLGACSGSQGGSSVSVADSVAVQAMDYEDAYEEEDGSLLLWQGFKLTGSHRGSLEIDEAKAIIRQGRLYAGFAQIEMHSLKVLDLEGEMAEKLRGHLLNEDFFEANTYPKARFELTGIPSEGVELLGLKSLQGNLSIKATTKNISIPLEEVTQHSDEEGALVYTIKTEPFRINRADWGVRYGSSSFFSDLGDKVIDDEIELSFVLILKK